MRLCQTIPIVLSLCKKRGHDMRRYKTVMTALLLFNVPAQSATPKDRGDCDKNVGNAQVVACARVIDDEAESKSDRAVAFANRGKALRVENDLDRARAYLEEAIRLDPNYGRAYLERAFVWRDQFDPGRAITDFNKAIRLDPKYAPPTATED